MIYFICWQQIYFVLKATLVELYTITKVVIVSIPNTV